VPLAEKVIDHDILCFTFDARKAHLPVGLGECAEGENAMRPGSNHAARLEPASGHWRINFLPAVKALRIAGGL
jgi:hypothetical protein